MLRNFLTFIFCLQVFVNNSYAQKQAPQVFTSQDECEQKTGMKCDYLMCDYIPQGKTFEEVCGKDFQKGWGPASQSLNSLNKDAHECEKKGGHWIEEGDIPGRCNLPTTDKGKVCVDKSDCEGECIAALTDEQYNKIVFSNFVIKTQGFCSEYKLVLGCHPHVESGEVKGILCQD